MKEAPGFEAERLENTGFVVGTCVCQEYVSVGGRGYLSLFAFYRGGKRGPGEVSSFSCSPTAKR